VLHNYIQLCSSMVCDNNQGNVPRVT
jgi:hypothetical protein